MAESTGIEWTERTYNPWIGCEKVSPGCTNCYAETFALQKKWLTKWGKSGERIITKTANDPVAWNQEALENGTRYTVFCASLSDVFEDHPTLPPLRSDLWRLVKRTPFLNWMILTKRAENILKMLPDDWGEGYANVCLMVSVESQQYFDKRVPLLQSVPARYRALSVEPLIEPLRMPPGSLHGIDLVIVGGESGKDARPMNPDWVRNARDACAREGVKFFFKQWGNYTPNIAQAYTEFSKGAVFTDYDSKPILLSSLDTESERRALVGKTGAQTVFRTKSKKSGGSLLDGKEYKEHIFIGQPDTPVAVETTALDATEQTELAQLEKIVAEGFDSFWRVGEALREIRDRGLYRGTHTNFTDYCRERWEISRTEAYRQIGAADVIEDIAAGPTVIELPANASQTRPLVHVKTPEIRRQVWERALKSGVPITAKVVEGELKKLSTRGKGSPRKAKAQEKETHSVPDNVKAKAAFADLKAALGDEIPKKLKNALKIIQEFVNQRDT